MITQDLGIATVYGYAKSKGYTGTEAEFAELMASYAEVGQTAVDAKDAAVAAKTAAQTAATTATNKASEATTAATTATTKAGEASTSASTATSAKDTAVSASKTATTKATEATTAAATATSAKTDAVAANTAAQSAKTAAQTAQTGAETAAASVQSSAAQIATNTEDIAQLKSDLTTKADATDMLKAFPTDTASGAVASFSDGANVPVKRLIVNIEPKQEGSGDPSPDNVRPISGWSEVNVHRMSKNRLPFPYYAKSQTKNGVTFTVNDDGSIKIKGTATATSNFELAQTDAENVVENGEYIVSLDGGINNVLRFLFGANNSGIAYDGAYGTDATSSKRITVSNSGMLGYCLIQVSSGATIDTTVYPMIRLASDSDPTYVPYNSVSLNIHLGQTVYGGKLDVVNGEKAVTRGILTIDSASGFEISVSDSNTTIFRKRNVIQARITSESDQISNLLKFNAGAFYVGYPNTFVIGSSGNLFLQFQNSIASTLEQLDALLSATPFTAVYTLNNPVTEEIDTHEVVALLGSNNVWADSGNSEVVYRADPTLYIGRLTEPDADMVADANIVSGQYFMVGNTLYKATANIASGGVITPNVNCTRKSLSEALNELNS